MIIHGCLARVKAVVNGLVTTLLESARLLATAVCYGL